MRSTIGASLGASMAGRLITGSTVTSGPAMACIRRMRASWSVPGSVRTSTSAVPEPAITFTFLPTWITVGVDRVAQHGAQRAAQRRVRHAAPRAARGRRPGPPARCERPPPPARTRRRNPATTGGGSPLGGAAARRATARPVDGRIVPVRHRAVARCPGRREAGPDDPLLGDLDPVHAPVTERHRVAAHFVQRRRRGPRVRREQVGPRVDPVPRPERAARFLVGHRGEDDVAPKRHARFGPGPASRPAPWPPCPSCPPRHDPRPRRRPAPRRTGRGSTPRPPPGTTSTWQRRISGGSGSGTVDRPAAARSRAAPGGRLEHLGRDPRLAAAPRRSSRAATVSCPVESRPAAQATDRRQD